MRLLHLITNVKLCLFLVLLINEPSADCHWQFILDICQSFCPNVDVFQQGRNCPQCATFRCFRSVIVTRPLGNLGNKSGYNNHINVGKVGNYFSHGIIGTPTNLVTTLTMVNLTTIIIFVNKVV